MHAVFLDGKSDRYALLKADNTQAGADIIPPMAAFGGDFESEAKAPDAFDIS
jgi:hypothetical protein